jgi:hypothetical protein
MLTQELPTPTRLQHLAVLDEPIDVCQYRGSGAVRIRRLVS